MQTIQGTYGNMLYREQWRRRRQTILERDGHACRNCGSRRHLQVHHRQYHRCRTTGHKLAPWSYPDRYLITLCETCHRAGHRAYRVPCQTV